jgi:hypothetical protein
MAFTDLNPPPYNSLSICEKYDITGIFARKLNQLQGFKMVCICDDSSSMSQALIKGRTKWDELKESIKIVLEIGAAYKVECDVMFLNQPGAKNVKSIFQLEEQFAKPPNGVTPLLGDSIENNRHELNERKLLVIIFTDGWPTLQHGSSKCPIRDFKKTLKDRNPMNRIFVTIVACTDDEYSLEYLNNWDNIIPNLDVVDDYDSEKKQIYAAGKVDTAFTYGDYIAKILLGSFIKEIDELDEPAYIDCCSII